MIVTSELCFRTCY